ncbi:carbohydrate phosphatase [Cucurbitaria berberidis CBS 394.84]|uniref:Carbohydrate phosphatase n=1 Tax=Cucurbitaria berberidis CBS 394.84 TaxID=1168544 RepID=A0A9P4GNU8_9PLEO|nr:carbohydrate phosphatase [Cucurbitaria berberidis CBS 394.84]KAF1849918.1 carbohydrate phosphatase [Cucurbitaria berberidis CBS 394.84]
MTTPYSAELRLALQVVHAASVLTKSVLRSLKNNVSAETKADDSPVTIADFAAQALLISVLHAVFPEDAFIGEESADALRSNETLADRVWQLVLQAKNAEETRMSDVQHVRSGTAAGGSGDEGALTLSFPASKEAMFDLIDLGGKGEVTRSGRVWVMDPVDGTLSFMQNRQYAVALCLLVDGVEKVGVIGCPNLAFDVNAPLGTTRIHEDQVDEDGYGVVLSAVKGQGTCVRKMEEKGIGEPRRIDLTQLAEKSPTSLNFVESTLGKTSLSQPEHKAVAESLGATWPGTVLWSQQLKYIALALGSTDVMVRVPKNVSRFTYIWDHAGGHILFQEAGGMISDFNGEQIDFGQGRQIKGERNWGMIATMPSLFEEVGRAVKDVLGRRPQ